MKNVDKNKKGFYIAIDITYPCSDNLEKLCELFQELQYSNIQYPRSGY